MSNNHILQIGAAQAQTALSPAQKKFNGLIKKIEAQKNLLAQWQECLSDCQQQALMKLEPLKKSMCEYQAEMVHLLDRMFAQHKFTRDQQEKLAYMICETCRALIEHDQRDDLKPLYNQYSGDDFDAQSQKAEEMAAGFLKSMMEDVFGADVDTSHFDFDPRDPLGSAARMAEQLQQQAQAEAARPARKKSAKQLAKETREQEEAAHVSKSIQAVYRQLVASLHPDREQDPVERERKTKLMQKVTVAYADKDLLQLLELQLAVEQIDQSKLNNIAEDRLRHFNKVLKDQLDELQAEVIMLEARIASMLQTPPFVELTPQRVIRTLKEDIRAMRSEIARIQSDLRAFQDVRQLKQWLKRFRIDEPAFDPFFG